MDKEMFSGASYRWGDPAIFVQLMRLYAQAPSVMALLNKEDDLPDVPLSERGFGVRDGA
jgi:hypothetical protein